VIDPEVTGAVTLNIVQPITRDALLPMLEAVLNSRGATMIEADGLIRVTALREGKPRGAARLGGAGALPGQETQVYRLSYLAPSEAQRLLDPMLGAGKVLLADDGRGIVVLQGAAADLSLARDALRLFDTDALAGTSVAMVLLQNAEAGALIPELDNLFGAVRRSAPANVIRFIPVERLNAVIVLSKVPRYVEDAQTWIARLDKVRRANDPQLHVYFVQHGKAAEVARTLQSAFSKSGGTEGIGPPPVVSPDLAPAPLPGLAGIGGPVASAAGAPAAAGGAALPPMPTDIAPAEGALRTAAPRAVPAEAPPADAGDIRIRPDEANNSLLILATTREYRQILQVLEQIDIPPLQVLIEATVAEVTLSNELRYGVQYFLNSGNFAAILSRGTSPTGITPTLPGFAATFAPSATPRAIIEALSSLTQTNVISTPRLLVLDNQSARLQVGDVVPIVTQTATSTLTAQPLTVNAVQYRDTGVVIEVSPRVNASGFITLDISQSVSDVVRTTTSNIDSPTIRQRRIRSAIGVQDGNTILLGGLIRENSGKDASGIPVLHEIPVLGALFGNRDDTVSRTELIVLLTPRVVRNPEEARDMTQELARKFAVVLTMQDASRPVPRPPR